MHKIIIILLRILLNNTKRNDIMNPLTSFTKTIHTKGRKIIMDTLKRVSPEEAGNSFPEYYRIYPTGTGGGN